MGWSKLGAKAASGVEFKDTILKVDSFRFEIHPAILNIHLLSHAAGLPFSSASVPDDGHAEVIFDTNPENGNFSTFTRLIHNGKYLYGDEVRLYRGNVISMQPVKGRTLCLDGELIKLPTDYFEVKIDEKKLKVLY
jgi:diacylglycerol kinase family enzyme